MNKARGYQSLTPANNMILKRKWDQSRFDMHRMKVWVFLFMLISEDMIFIQYEYLLPLLLYLKQKWYEFRLNFPWHLILIRSGMPSQWLITSHLRRTCTCISSWRRCKWRRRGEQLSRETTGSYWRRWHTSWPPREEWTTQMTTNTEGIIVFYSPIPNLSFPTHNFTYIFLHAILNFKNLGEMMGL